jgi:hypothetical protein
MREPACTSFRLGGGTALALQLGHRLSDDLDLFCPDGFDPHELYGAPGLSDAVVTGFVGYDVFPVLRSLVYFMDAEDEPQPQMLRAMKWNDVKRNICDAVERVERQ